jgi:hypothetical protein
LKKQLLLFQHLLIGPFLKLELFKKPALFVSKQELKKTFHLQLEKVLYVYLKTPLKFVDQLMPHGLVKAKLVSYALKLQYFLFQLYIFLIKRICRFGLSLFFS